MTRAALALAALPALAAADPAPPPPASAKPDPIAEDQAREANLESDAPRDGVTFGGMIGGGLILGKGSVDTIPAISLRLGHVMTRDVVGLFEISGGTLRHRVAMGAPTYTDSSISLLVGAQVYVTDTLWLRGEVGLNVHTIDGMNGQSINPGPAGGAGAGLDMVRWKRWAIDVEIWGVLSYDRKGALLTSCLGFGLWHY
ncbi:MAG TPA: hypothetical protein VLX92_26205 [Kofleriaceae bacterium]|nr:hypothetical protein [Kofleriaceae bacterium]